MSCFPLHVLTLESFVNGLGRFFVVVEKSLNFPTKVKISKKKLRIFFSKPL